MKELEDRITKLESVLGRGNFNTASVQQKDATFNGGFSLMNRTTLPAYSKKGDIAIKDGQAYMAAAANTFYPIGRSYAGKVRADGVSISLPSGWVSSRTGTGNFTIAHSLGTSSYTILAVHGSGVGVPGSLGSVNAPIVLLNSAGAGVDADFWFTLTLWT